MERRSPPRASRPSRPSWPTWRATRGATWPKRIMAARELGDLKENAEYHIAKEDQAHLETKIMRLVERLRNAVVVEAPTDNERRGLRHHRDGGRRADRTRGDVDDRGRDRGRPRGRQALGRVAGGQGADGPAAAATRSRSGRRAACAASASCASGVLSAARSRRPVGGSRQRTGPRAGGRSSAAAPGPSSSRDVALPARGRAPPARASPCRGPGPPRPRPRRRRDRRRAQLAARARRGARASRRAAPARRSRSPRRTARGARRGRRSRR